MAIEVFNRFEYKYKLEKDLTRKLICEFNERLNLDEYCKHNGTYHIVNRYIDSKHYALIRHSIGKPKYKHKLRIRTYDDHINDDELVFFEIKKKVRGLVNKRRCKMTYGEAKYLMKHKELPVINDYTNKQILKELIYILKQDDYAEKTTITYDRVAFFDNERDLRISFDFNIKSDKHTLLEKDCSLMEIKTFGGMPLWLVELLDKYNVRKQSFSKYGTEFLLTLEENKNERITN